MTSDSRVVQGCMEAAGIHEATVDGLASGEDELVSIGSPSEAVDQRSLDHRQSEIVAKRNLIRRQRVMVKR
jgi:hypothetical protein